MIEYRPFRNLDPPALCEIWRNHPPVRALFQPMTSVVLEDTVLSKPFFDREGLIVATDDQRPVGFVHAGFGPNAAGTALDPPIGATCMLMVVASRPSGGHCRAAAQTQRSVSPAHGRAVAVSAVEWHAVAPFYNGLYGGCSVPGILESDLRWSRLYRAAGYAERSRRLILQRSLAGFRPVVDRQQIQYRAAVRNRSPGGPAATDLVGSVHGRSNRSHSPMSPDRAAEVRPAPRPSSGTWSRWPAVGVCTRADSRIWMLHPVPSARGWPVFLDRRIAATGRLGRRYVDRGADSRRLDESIEADSRRKAWLSGRRTSSCISGKS